MICLDLSSSANLAVISKVLLHSHSEKLRPEDFLRTSSKNVLWTSPYGPLCNAKWRCLPRSWGCPLPTSLGRWNMTFWGRPNVTSWGRLQTVLYVTPWDVPYRRLEDVFCRRYEDVPIRSNIWLQGTCHTDVLRASLRDFVRRF